MINEYKFYYGYAEYIINKPEERFDVNNHKVSKEIYNKLYKKVSKTHKLHITQNCYWRNLTSGGSSIGRLKILRIKEKDNE